MIYTVSGQVYGIDSDLRGELRPSVLLSMLEDAGAREMEAFPPSNDDLRRDGYAFILSRIVLQIDRPARDGERVEAQSFATDSRGLSYNRCYRLLCGGECIARAYSTWALLDFVHHTLVRVGTLGKVGGEPEPPLTLDLPLRERMPAAEEFTEIGKRKVYYSDTDLNGHLNNTKYLNFLCDFVPEIEKKSLRGANISYIAEAPYGETLTVCMKEDGDRYFFKTVRSDGKTNCEAILYF